MNLTWRGLVVALAGLCGCAIAGPSNNGAGGRDGSITVIDAPIGQHDDAPLGGADAPQIMIDAPTQCTPTPHELLQNPAFDMAPMSTGWTEVDIDPMYPIVTSDDGVTEKSAPNKAWMGGVAQANANDELYQDVTIPANTTQLVLSGYYQVRTEETDPFPYDTGTLEVDQTSGTQIDSVLSLDNTGTTTAWKVFHHTISQDLSGQTVRVHFATSNDDTNATSFFFDSMSFQATACQ